MALEVRDRGGELLWLYHIRPPGPGAVAEPSGSHGDGRDVQLARTAAELVRRGKRKQARRLVKRHLKESPNDPIGWEMRAWVEGTRHPRFTYLRRALECGHPDAARLRIAMCGRFLDHHIAPLWMVSTSKLEAVLGKLGELESVEAIVTRAHARRHLGDLDAASTLLQQAQEIAPDHPALHAVYAEIAIASGYWERADHHATAVLVQPRSASGDVRASMSFRIRDWLRHASPARSWRWASLIGWVLLLLGFRWVPEGVLMDLRSLWWARPLVGTLFVGLPLTWIVLYGADLWRFRRRLPRFRRAVRALRRGSLPEGVW